MPINETKLRDLVRDAARAAFEQVREENPDESFYGFALYTDDGLMTIMPAANSEQGFKEACRNNGFKKPDEKAYARWATAEWGYEAVGADHFDAAHELLNGPDRGDAGDADDEAAYRALGNTVIGSMVNALNDLDQSGFFGAGAEREKVTLFVSVSDSDAAESIENESAKQLNPPAVAERFIKRYE